MATRLWVGETERAAVVRSQAARGAWQRWRMWSWSLRRPGRVVCVVWSWCPLCFRFRGKPRGWPCLTLFSHVFCFSYFSKTVVPAAMTGVLLACLRQLIKGESSLKLLQLSGSLNAAARVFHFSSLRQLPLAVSGLRLHRWRLPRRGARETAALPLLLQDSKRITTSILFFC